MGFLQDYVNVFGLISLSIFLSVLTIAFYAHYRSPANLPRKCPESRFLLFAVASYVVVVCVLCWARIANPPFVRNGFFLILFVWTFLFTIEKHRIGFHIAIALLSISTIWTCVKISQSFIMGNPLSFPNLAEIDPVAFTGNSNLGHVTEVLLSDDEDLTIQSLWENAYPNTLVHKANRALNSQCGIGKYPDLTGQRLVALDIGGFVKTICFP